MLGILEPVFGQRGALAAEFVLTVLLVLALGALIVWIARRYAPGGAAGVSRARVARLAIVDAMTVDSRRKLVLVRRDNVEHLILIGGPSDLVVEPSIVRTRATAQRPAPVQPAQNGLRAQAPATVVAAAPPPAPAPLPPPVIPKLGATGGAAEPIPFPPLRAQPTQRPAGRHGEPVVRRIDPAAALGAAGHEPPVRRVFPSRPSLDRCRPRQRRSRWRSCTRTRM